MLVLKPKHKSVFSFLGRFKLEKKKNNRPSITIDELMPLWSHAFDLMAAGKYEEAKGFREYYQMSISRGNRCCVGEIYGFSRDYHMLSDRSCEICVDFSYSHGIKNEDGSFKSNGFIELDTKIDGNKNWRKSSTVQDFLKHWNEKHL